MFVVLAIMVVGIFFGYVFRSKTIKFIHRFIITLIWLLLFLLGMELGLNDNVIKQFGQLGFDAFLLASAATLGSVIAAWVLWQTVKNKIQTK